MDEELPLKVTHDVSQTLQRKLEGMHSVTTLQYALILTYDRSR